MLHGAVSQRLLYGTSPTGRRHQGAESVQRSLRRKRKLPCGLRRPWRVELRLERFDVRVGRRRRAVRTRPLLPLDHAGSMAGGSGHHSREGGHRCRLATTRTGTRKRLSSGGRRRVVILTSRITIPATTSQTTTATSGSSTPLLRSASKTATSAQRTESFGTAIAVSRRSTSSYWPMAASESSLRLDRCG